MRKYKPPKVKKVTPEIIRRRIFEDLCNSFPELDPVYIRSLLSSYFTVVNNSMYHKKAFKLSWFGFFIPTGDNYNTTSLEQIIESGIRKHKLEVMKKHNFGKNKTEYHKKRNREIRKRQIQLLKKAGFKFTDSLISYKENKNIFYISLAIEN